MKIIDSLRVGRPRDLERGELFIPQKGQAGMFVKGTVGDDSPYLIELDGDEPYLAAPDDEFNRDRGLIAVDIDFEVDTEDFRVVFGTTEAQRGELLLAGDAVALMGIAIHARFPVFLRGSGTPADFAGAVAFKKWRIVRYPHGKTEVLFEAGVAEG